MPALRKWTTGFLGTALFSRDEAASGGSNGDSIAAQDASVAQGSSTIADWTIYLGIGLGVGGAFLVGLVVVSALIVRKRKEHKKRIEAMEVEQALQSAQMQQVREGPRPVTSVGCSTIGPLSARAGWGALASDETVNEPEPVARADRRERFSVSLPKKIKKRGIPLKRLKRLTAILESPMSRNSPAVPMADTMPGAALPQTAVPTPQPAKAYNLRTTGEDDVFVCPGSPKPDVLPSFAIGSPGRYGAGIANNDNNRAYRSRSLGAMPPIPGNAVFGSTLRSSRGPLHKRSMSLGAPATRPPNGPVPPLPVIYPHASEAQGGARQGVHVSRDSTSSQDSTGSSVLVATPILTIPRQEHAFGSPTVVDVIAQDDHVSLKNISASKWQNPSTTEPKQLTGLANSDSSEGVGSHRSIRSNIARYNAEGEASNRMSSLSKTSPGSFKDRFSVAHIGLADQVSISRVSSENSLTSQTGVRKITTPRRATRTSVSESGSPAERKRPGVLRDISGNSIAPSRQPSRQPSNATEDSSRSSNGNPFHWDQPLTKPSALKGSPNARKGHRRQNCVRISTLTPQILGPPPSRPTSPSIMHGIEEETGDGDEAATQPGMRFVSNQRRLSRPLSASSLGPNLRLQNRRISLTPSSPTLSVWTAFQEHGLPSQVSDSQLSGSAGTRSASRQSNCSSLHSIPSFPSPVKAVASTTQLSQPVPEFYLSRPSTDIDERGSSSPYAIPSSEPDIPSSPPMQTAKLAEYDPAHQIWPLVEIPAPSPKEYDPASPAWENVDLERSSASFPFAINANNSDDTEVSPRSRPASYGGDLPDTPPVSPPVSPKTMPAGFQDFFDKKETGVKPARASEKLTSANASSLMSRVPSKVDFPGAPVLAPPEEDESYAAITPEPRTSRQRSASNATYLIPKRPPPPPPLPSEDERDDCMPLPLHIGGKTSPTGPRVQPAQSVLKNAMALRRMNSETNTLADRESRRFVRLGREASPLLPWIGSPDPDGSCAAMNELFDFDFVADTRSGAEEDADLAQINMTEVERKLDGALAGIESSPCERLRRDDGNPSVWDDGERYWNQSQSSPIGLATSSPIPIRGTPIKRALAFESPKSIQHTPRSLYDSEGFLKT